MFFFSFRGKGPLKTTMDVINAAKKISEYGTKLDKLARQIADQVCFLLIWSFLHMYVSKRKISYLLTGVHIVKFFQVDKSIYYEFSWFWNRQFLTIFTTITKTWICKNLRKCLINWCLKRYESDVISIKIPDLSNHIT